MWGSVKHFSLYPIQFLPVQNTPKKSPILLISPIKLYKKDIYPLCVRSDRIPLSKIPQFLILSSQFSDPTVFFKPNFNQFFLQNFLDGKCLLISRIIWTNSNAMRQMSLMWNKTIKFSISLWCHFGCLLQFESLKLIKHNAFRNLKSLISHHLFLFEL